MTGPRAMVAARDVRAARSEVAGGGDLWRVSDRRNRTRWATVYRDVVTFYGDPPDGVGGEVARADGLAAVAAEVAGWLGASADDVRAVLAEVLS